MPGHTSALPAAARVLSVAAFCAAFLSPLSARADRGTARLASGGVVTGEIEVYLPGERVVIRTDSGEVLTLAVGDLLELQIAPSRPGAPMPSAPAPQPVPPAPEPQAVVPEVPAAPAGATYIIVPQYAPMASPYTEVPPVHPPREALQPPRARRPSLFWPLMTLSGSAAAFVSGAMLVLDSGAYCSGGYYYDDCDDDDPARVGGLVLMGLSLPLFILTATYLLPRKVRARRAHRRAQQAYQLSLVPTADPRAGHYGASATLRF